MEASRTIKFWNSFDHIYSTACLVAVTFCWVHSALVDKSQKIARCMLRINDVVWQTSWQVGRWPLWMHASLLPWISPPSLTILTKQWAPSAAVVRIGSTETTSSSSREAVAVASSTTGADGTTTETTETSKFQKSTGALKTPGSKKWFYGIYFICWWNSKL